MTEQALDLRRSVRIVRRRWIAVVIVAMLGLLAGVANTVLKPPMLASSALVIVPPATRDVPTEVVIADSDPVLSGALPRVRPAISLQALRNKIQVKSLTSNIITITALAKTAGQAEGNANAVAESFVAYANNGSNAAGKVQARLLEPALTATGRSLPVDLLINGGIGAIAGVLIGAIGALAFSRRDRQLRERDEIAAAIGVPVLASISVRHPADAGHWARLLGDYEPSVVHAWQLRNALHYLGHDLSPPRAGHGESRNGDSRNGDSLNGESLSVAILSLSADRGALALGPQLAVFAASIGVPTVLVIGPQQDMSATAALRTACEAPPSHEPAGLLRLAVADEDVGQRLPGVKLTVILAVVDGRDPRVADTMGADVTVLGVSAGAATAAQLAGVAVSAAAEGRQIEGILVADPESTDRTTGRVPQLTRPTHRRGPARLTSTPTRLNGLPREKRTTETRP